MLLRIFCNLIGSQFILFIFQRLPRQGYPTILNGAKRDAGRGDPPVPAPEFVFQPQHPWNGPRRTSSAIPSSSSPRGTFARMEESVATVGSPAPLLAHSPVDGRDRNRWTACRTGTRRWHPVIMVTHQLLYPVSEVREHGVREYVDTRGHSPYARWFERLDARAAAKVATALFRMERGNLSNAKGVGGGVFECRIDFGPGYRIYFGKDGDTLSANVRETRSTQRIRVGRRQRKRTCWDCEREWKRMVVPLEPGRPSEARQLLRTRR